MVFRRRLNPPPTIRLPDRVRKFSVFLNPPRQARLSEASDYFWGRFKGVSRTFRKNVPTCIRRCVRKFSVFWNPSGRDAFRGVRRPWGRRNGGSRTFRKNVPTWIDVAFANFRCSGIPQVGTPFRGVRRFSGTSQWRKSDVSEKRPYLGDWKRFATFSRSARSRSGMSGLSVSKNFN